MHLLELEKENYTLKAENDSYKRMYDQERRRVNHLEEKILVHESSLDTLNRKLKNNEEDIKEYRRLLEMKHNQLTKTEMDKAKQKMKYQSRIAVETDKMNRQLDQKLREQENFMSVSVLIINILCFVLMKFCIFLGKNEGKGGEIAYG